jgi:ribonuclease E
VDIGTPKNAVLYWGDVQFEDEEKDTDTDTPHKVHSKRIEQLLKHGQMILCQVTKNPIGLKGARLTQEITLAGRFVVLMPGSDSGGISKRIPDQERRRLRKFLDEVKPADCGIIVRTAAAGVSMEELKADVEHLLSDWAEIEKKMHGANEPKLLYSEPHLALKFIREEFNGDYRAVIIDDYDLYKLLKSYVAEFDENLAGRIIYYDAKEERLPIFEKYNIHEQVHKALDKKVWLNSGGSLIIEKTEALTVIDVNTGKNVGKSSLGETVYQNNLEAAREIARQLRLRDIGGIIVIDFIDMEEKQHRDEVVTILRKSLSEDKTPSQVYPISDLGLVEMTRKRIGKGLLESISEECPICHGTGFVIEERL